MKMTNIVASRLDEEISILRSWKQIPGGYDAVSKRVNESYARTQDIHQTMRETRLPFDLVWEMTGMKDEIDWMVRED